MPSWEIVIIVISCIFGFLFLTSLCCFILTNVRLFEINFMVPFEFKLSGYRDDKEKMLKDFEYFDNQKFEEYTIKSYDKLKLKGYLLRVKDSKKLVICFHGYRASARNDFSCVVPFYQKLGYNILFVNQRSHGKSKGKIITFGVRERKDVLSWINFSKKLGFNEIVLAGVSMGASTVLMAAEFIKKGDVKKIVADCGFTSPYEIIKETIKTIKFPVYPIIWFINFYSILFCGINFKKYNTKESIKKTEIPILFIHGTDDKFVPSKMSTENFEINKNNEILLVEGAHHAGSYMKNPKIYEKKVEEFLNKD